MKTSANQKLGILRDKLNQIDNQIIRLLEDRLKIASDVADVKNSLQMPLTDIKREQDIITRLKKSAKNVILHETIANLYQSIFALSKNIRIINNNKELSFSKIGIIGLGLIGGSIAKALKSKNKSIQIYTLKRNSLNNKQALEENIIDQEFNNLAELIINCELIILASNIDSIIQIAEDINKLDKNKIIIIDVGSVKSKIAQKFKELTNDNIEYLPTHPMAGSEKIGFSASASTLFINQPWIITPHKKNTKETVEKINSLIRYLGSIPKIINSDRHDELIAIISHLVFLISTYLFAYPFDKNPKALELAGTGFESITRLTSGNPLMHHQIYTENYENISRVLSDFLNFIKKEKIDKKNSLKFFERNKKNRDKFINSE